MIRGSRTFVPAAVAAVLFAAMPSPALARRVQQPLAAQAAAADDRSLEVAVTYKGQGEVSKAHEVTVFLFTDPNITEASQPVAIGTVEENGGHCAFSGLPPVVYIAVVYDDKGTYERDSAPPPGTPVMLYGMASGAAEAVKPGKDAKVTVTFDDSNRM